MKKSLIAKIAAAKLLGTEWGSCESCAYQYWDYESPSDGDNSHYCAKDLNPNFPKTDGFSSADCPQYCEGYRALQGDGVCVRAYEYATPTKEMEWIDNLPRNALGVIKRHRIKRGVPNA